VTAAFVETFPGTLLLGVADVKVGQVVGRRSLIRFLSRVMCETSCVHSAATRRHVCVSSSGTHTSGRKPLAWSLARTLASILSVFTLAQAIARTCTGLATTIRRTNGAISRTRIALLPAASRTTSSSALSVLAKARTCSCCRTMRPPLLSFPFSRIATSANERWTSRPTILICTPLLA
jgi:hypothetical protein